ncbi:4-amino-4-deoxychorismate lyase [Maritimibacter sp. 55A14]|uniref:aminotransferase class IV family protein n=1 Tax=Maritimibacter sp. 55A14 TaxID=2174844 RepID=UPI000D615D62|nr:aminotransferase class IV family protein [Maritimibacter sp. 55A14]PWE33343.1 4-amino-4-deoxychorismate lyase [Maritimibacter sp. 55A14]
MESVFRKTCPDGLPGDLKVVETLRYAPGQGAVRAALHLARLERTCARLGIRLDLAAARALLDNLAGPVPMRLRLTVGADGAPELEQAALQLTYAPWRIGLAAERLHSADPWLGVKTTRRALYDRVRAALPDDLQEMVFLNERGEVCEGTITNVFVERDGTLLTPLLDCGVLPGVLRRSLLENGRAREAVLWPRDLLAAPGAIHVGNSLRGLIRAELAA